MRAVRDPPGPRVRRRPAAEGEEVLYQLGGAQVRAAGDAAAEGVAAGGEVRKLLGDWGRAKRSVRPVLRGVRQLASGRAVSTTLSPLSLRTRRAESNCQPRAA